MNKKNGFTLVELLAVIVILGILAVVIFPRINGAIENSRKNSAVISAKEYNLAITQFFLNDDIDLNVSSKVSSGQFEVDDGFLKKDNLNYKINFNGEAPKSGKVNLVNGDVVSGCLVVDKYSIIFMDSSVYKIEKGECPKLVPYHKDDDIIYYSPDDIKANPLYFNPELAEYCSETEYSSNMSNASGGVYPKTGCLKWYAYSENPDGTINMLMAHNTTAKNMWVTDGRTTEHPNIDLNSDFYDGASVGITYDYALTGTTIHYLNSAGPVTALKQLKSDTSTWNSKLIRNDSYQPTVGERRYVINYVGYKARLISAEEISAILNIEWVGYKSFAFDESANQNNVSRYSWLYDYTWDCIKSGCTVETEDLTNLTSGYWTSTSDDGGWDLTKTTESWIVQREGILNTKTVDFSQFAGLRPVITFSKPDNF